MPSPVESRQSSVNSRHASVPFCSLDCPFFCWSCPLFLKSYALLRMVTPFTEGVTPFADGLRSFPSDFQELRRPTPLPRVGGSFAMHVGSARRGNEYVFLRMHYSKLSFLLKMRFCLVYSTSCRPGSAFINRGGCRRKPPSDKAFRRGLHRLT